MICRQCLQRASVLQISFRPIRNLTSSAPASSPPPAGTLSASAVPTLSTPLSLPHNASSRSKPKMSILPVSISPAGTTLKGLNFLKGREDPLALPEEDYPEWLWKILESGKKRGSEGKEEVGDEFSKSKKQRRMAAKRQRKLVAHLLASGDTEALAPKVPLQQQTIDLPANENGTIRGALGAAEKREEVRKAMRSERRAKIKERNFLKGI